MSSIPFRFKAGGGDQHHHRNTTKFSHKSFKSKHATKNMLKELAKGKKENTETASIHRRRTPHQQTMSKFDRKNQAKQIRETKRQQNKQSGDLFIGRKGAPKIVAVIPLCEDLDAMAAVQSLSQAVDAESQWPLEGYPRVWVDRFSKNLLFVPIKRKIITALDACRCADCVVFLLSPTEEPGEEGELLLKTIEGQGVSNVLTMVQHLNNVDSMKTRAQITASLKSYITHFFPNQEKILSLDSESECSNAMRSLCTGIPRGIKWREDRSWVLAERTQWQSSIDTNATHGEVIFTGVVRGKNLKANRLVQVGDWGHFQIERISDASLAPPGKRIILKTWEAMTSEAKGQGTADGQSLQETLETPNGEQEDLAELAPFEATMDDVDAMSSSEAPKERRGVLLDDHHYFSDDETHLPEPPRRVPKGTSSYQSAWFLGDISDSGSDYEDEMEPTEDMNMTAPALPQDGVDGLDRAFEIDPTGATPSEYPQSEMFLDPSPDQEASQLAEYRASRNDEAKDDLEFPDEIELHPNVLARERLSRYRGLKSLKTSHWETSEDGPHQPEDWPRYFDVPNYKPALNRIRNEALVGGVSPGKRVNIHLRSVPLSLRQNHSPARNLTLYSLHPHEQKYTIANISITLASSHPTPLRSKDTLLLQLGPRRFTIKPLFSHASTTPNNVHKYLRYLHPGQTAVATFVAPLTWGSIPALFFLPPCPSSSTYTPTFVATGTSLPPSKARVIAKRVILTGHPYKIHKKLVTIRYMFFNKEDVNWFKALQLWTRRGRGGFIKESLGTHGYFKAEFDGRINPMDAVGVSLYKRVWPRVAVAWDPDIGRVEERGGGVREVENEGGEMILE
ncbi:hypothetical protein MMC21_002504 [Puttea exsequens]|nr:hypothetical protein [Puttea exsequens]